jgi:hypothetical protein
MILLNSDANLIDFLNIVEDYKYKQVHLYIEHMVDDNSLEYTFHIHV